MTRHNEDEPRPWRRRMSTQAEEDELDAERRARARWTTAMKKSALASSCAAAAAVGSSGGGF